MTFELTDEQVVDYITTEFLKIRYRKHDRGGWYSGFTYFKIYRNDESPYTPNFHHKYRRKIGNITVTIRSSNRLNNDELFRIVHNPFAFVDQHPFSH